MQELLLEIAVGFVGGVLSGLLGIGGGALFVPAMVLLLDVPQQEAQGISLAVIVVTAVVGAVTHYRHGNVDVRTAAWVVGPAVVASVVGASIAGALSSQALQRVFGAVILFVSLQMLYTSFRMPEAGGPDRADSGGA